MRPQRLIRILIILLMLLMLPILPMGTAAQPPFPYHMERMTDSPIPYVEEPIVAWMETATRIYVVSLVQEDHATLDRVLGGPYTLGHLGVWDATRRQWQRLVAPDADVHIGIGADHRVWEIGSTAIFSHFRTVIPNPNDPRDTVLASAVDLNTGTWIPFPEIQTTYTVHSIRLIEYVDIHVDVTTVVGSDVYVLGSVNGLAGDGSYLFRWDMTNRRFLWPHTMEPVTFDRSAHSIPDDVATYYFGKTVISVGPYLFPHMAMKHPPAACRSGSEPIEHRFVALDTRTGQWVCLPVANIASITGDGTNPWYALEAITADPNGVLWMAWFRGCWDTPDCDLVFGRIDTTRLPLRLEVDEAMTVDVHRAFPGLTNGRLPHIGMFYTNGALYAIGNFTYDPRDIGISRYNPTTRRWEMRHREDLYMHYVARNISVSHDGSVIFFNNTGYDAVLLTQPSCVAVAKWNPRTDQWSCPWPVGIHSCPCGTTRWLHLSSIGSMCRSCGCLPICNHPASPSMIHRRGRIARFAPMTVPRSPSPRSATCGR